MSASFPFSCLTPLIQQLYLRQFEGHQARVSRCTWVEDTRIKIVKYKFSDKRDQSHSLKFFSKFSEIQILYVEEHLTDRNSKMLLRNLIFLNAFKKYEILYYILLCEKVDSEVTCLIIYHMGPHQLGQPAQEVNAKDWMIYFCSEKCITWPRKEDYTIVIFYVDFSFNLRNRE